MTNFRRGDLVKANTTIPTTFSDRLAGTGLDRGTVGVVTATTGNRMTVEFKDPLWGYVTAADVPMRSCRLHRRNYGVETFHHHRRRTRPLRLGIALFTAAPFLFFAVDFFMSRGLTLHGFIPALAASVVASGLQFIEWAITAPRETALLLGFLALIGWVAKHV